MTVRMVNDEKSRLISTVLHPHSSIGTHAQSSGDDMNYIISGYGKAVCDGKEELLKPGVMPLFFCPHLIITRRRRYSVFLLLWG